MVCYREVITYFIEEGKSMSNNVILRPHNFIPYTLVPNFFIDRYMQKANGEFIKVYLVLLRYMSIGQLDFNLGHIADHLMMTESDILRALKYFQQDGLLTLTFNNNQLAEIHFTHMDPISPEPTNRSITPDYRHPSGDDYPSAYGDDSYSSNMPSSQMGENNGHYNNRQEYSQAQPYDSHTHGYNSTIHTTPNHSGTPSRKDLNIGDSDYNGKSTTRPDSSHLKVISSKPDYTNKEIAGFAERDDFNQLLYITQKYLGKTLSATEVKTIISFNDWLGLPIDVVELMIEYCVDNDHRNMRYIEKVAIDWADNGINTIEKAKVRTETYQKSYFVILKAYGITDRSPTPNQIQLMDKWLNDYQFDTDIIVEACQRTITQINKAEMRYTDSILNTWHREHVRTLEDIRDLDTKRPPKNFNNQQGVKKNNSFNGYNQRSYDYDELEKKALEMRLRESGKRYSS